MNFRPCNSGLVRSLLALSVSLAVVISSHAFAFAAFSSSNRQSQGESIKSDEGLLSASVVATEAGVRLEWHQNFDAGNVGFNVYRVKDGKRTRINREIIPGSVFSASPNDPQSLLSRGGHSYAWFDPGGTRDSVYYIESVSLDGLSSLHEAMIPAPERQASELKLIRPIKVQTQTSEIASADQSEANGSNQTMYPGRYPAGSPAATASRMLASTIEDQWSIAAQPALKIAIKKEGWYRVTQPQMAAAGFNPSVEITNLQLFVDGLEVAISTSQSGGPFGPADYIEFFGRGLDVPSSDVRTYYLIAGNSPGKRVRGELQVDSPTAPSPSPQPVPSPAPTPASNPKGSAWQWVNRVARQLSVSAGPAIGIPVVPVIVWRGEAEPRSEVGDQRSEIRGPKSEERSLKSEDGSQKSEDRIQKSADRNQSSEVRDHRSEISGQKSEVRSQKSEVRSQGLVVNGVASVAGASRARVLQGASEKKSSRRISRKRKKQKRSRQKRAESRREYSHAVAAAALAPSNFECTVERKDRGAYFGGLLNGDVENWFGSVLSGPPVSLNLTIPNPDPSATGPAQLEFALQGVASSSGNHQVNVSLNGALVASLDFDVLAHPVQVVSILPSQLQNGTNTITFTRVSESTSIVDYVRLTYPHAFKADSGSLKFNLRGSQTRSVDGFSTPLVRLIDYTDPLAVGVTKPVSEPSALGYSITVPMSESRSKGQRSLYAIPEGQFDQPSALSFNQPSSLNLHSNAGDFLIIAHKTLIPSLTANAPPLNTSLVAQRQNQGMTVSVVDIEDVYDEFSYGLHGPQAIKDFLRHASVNWATKPKYVVFAGDATYDPRNYLNIGSFDLVPTKLVDATYNETASDDWLADFDDNGIADIPIGRLPVRTAAEADLVISKIVNYAPSNVPEAAMLVADNPGTPPVWDFEESNDNVQALLPGSMAVQRINIRELSNADAKANIIAGFNQGKAVVNYSGHGNVNVWTGANIFHANDATALTNGNKLSFVVVMDCLNGYYHAPVLLSLSEALLKAPNGGAVAAFASSGLTTTFGQRQMELQLYTSLYTGQPIALGDAIKIAKAASFDIDVRRTWIFFGDPSMKIR